MCRYERADHSGIRSLTVPHKPFNLSHFISTLRLSFEMNLDVTKDNVSATYVKTKIRK